MCRTVLRVHRWLGLTIGLLWVLRGLTGAFLVFYRDLDRLSVSAPVAGPMASLDAIVRSAKAATGNATLTRLSFTDGHRDLIEALYTDRAGRPRALVIDASSAAVVRATDVPTYYEYNLARVETGDPGLSAQELADAAEPHLAGLAHRRIEVHDTEAGLRLRPGFEAMGWVAERLAFLDRELPAPPRSGSHGCELRVEGFEASRPLRLAWQGESPWDDTPEFVVTEEAVARRRGTRAVVGYREGEPAGFAAFSVRGDCAEVELAFCLPERRNGGLGGDLIARALAEAESEGAGHALIEADDEGGSKRLYERLGFQTVWVRHVFTRKPG